MNDLTYTQSTYTYNTYDESGRVPSGPCDQIFCDSQSASLRWYNRGIYNCFPIIQPLLALPECIQSVLENVEIGSSYYISGRLFQSLPFPCV